MPTSNWNKDEIKKLALVSGRPLEIQCAEVFLKARWRVRLGTFYTDVSSEKIRELDFLAEREFPFVRRDANREEIHWTLRVRVLGSCKGFPPDQGPVTYSVASGSSSVESACLMCYECGLRGRTIADAMRRRGAERFLVSAGFSGSQQVVGFDVLQRKEDQKKPPQHVEYLRKTDRDLYDGLDSAIKAALFWYREDRRQVRLRIGGGDRGYIALSIPLLVSSLPFWEVPIGTGTAGDPRLKSSGFHVSLLPSGDEERPPEPLMSLLWEAAKLQELTTHLDVLTNYFVDDTQLAVERT